MRRVRFQVPYSADIIKKSKEMKSAAHDTRPMFYPTQFPAWQSGTGFDHDTWVAYAPDENTVEYIKHYWPEFNGEFSFNDFVEKITSTGRFPVDYKIYDENGVAKVAAYKAGETPTC